MDEFYYLDFATLAGTGQIVAAGVLHGSADPRVLSDIGNDMIKAKMIHQYKVLRWIGSDKSFEEAFEPALIVGQVYADALGVRQENWYA